MKCLWPVNHIGIDAYGYIRPCGAWELWDINSQPFNINENSLNDYFKSKNYLSLIEKLKDNQFGEGCRYCKIHEEQNIPSMKDESFEDYKITDEFKISNMEIKFGNLCNQGCVMCSPKNSSVLEQEHIKFKIDNKQENINFHLHNQAKSNIKNKPWFTNEERLNEVVEMASQAKLVRFTGGEPTVNNNLYKFLSKLVNLNPKVTIRITTNGHTFNQNLINILQQFKKVILQVSIDGYKKTQEYIRWPSTWNRIENNITKMLSMENTRIQTISTVQILNVGEINELIDWAIDKGIHQINAYPVWSPSYFRPCLASDERKQKFLESIKKYKNISTVDYSNLESIGKTLTEKKDTSLLLDLKKYLKRLDQIRKTNYNDIVKL